MVVCIIQARMGSSRLPGKVLMDLSGKPVLWHIVHRLQNSEYIDRIVVATSSASSDETIAAFCKEYGIHCFCGSENDVLDRFYKAACHAGCSSDDIIVRITADCPLIDYKIVDAVIGLLKTKQCDYASNAFPPTYPDGLDVEAMTFQALKEAAESAVLPSEREHVTPYIRSHEERFRIEALKNAVDLSHMRWTIDHMEDYKYVKHIYDALYRQGDVFLTDEVLEFLNKNPGLEAENNRYTRNEGYQKSLQKDKEFIVKVKGNAT